MRSLYFICPTDRLEPVIDERSKRKNFYYSSLGNSLVLSDPLLKEFAALIESEDIREIIFVLSDDNTIIADCLKTRKFAGITGIKNFYEQLNNYSGSTSRFWQTSDDLVLILSYHLNNKIGQLKKALHGMVKHQPVFCGKIYHRENNMFGDIYSELVCTHQGIN